MQINNIIASFIGSSYLNQKGHLNSSIKALPMIHQLADSYLWLMKLSCSLFTYNPVNTYPTYLSLAFSIELFFSSQKHQHQTTLRPI